MPRYHFHLRDYGTVRRDLEETELSDGAAARAHAEGVAEELMQHASFRTRYRSLGVEGSQGEPKFNLFFADVDKRLARHSPASRAAESKACRQIGALTDLCCALRATLSAAPWRVASSDSRAPRLYPPPRARRDIPRCLSRSMVFSVIVSPPWRRAFRAEVRERHAPSSRSS
jgi:uncharacterized protein DUF6894